MSTPTDWVEQFERETPESKLELIDGRLIIGNSLAGSRYYLHDLLSCWGVEAVMAFASCELWRAALYQTFAPFAAPDPAAPLNTWRSWAETVEFEPRLEPAGPMVTGSHHSARQRLASGVSHACGMGHYGTSLGHDFVMQLGNDAFTPDGFLIGRQATERLFERYLHGPAELVWEVLLPGHERQDREVKFHAYETGGVLDYWIVDPEAQAIDFFRLVGGKYRRQTPDDDGRYRPASFPGLALLIEKLWQKVVPG